MIHFLADLSAMMMAYEFSQRRRMQATIFQFTGLLLFYIIGIHSGLSGFGWQYLIADLVFTFPAIRNVIYEFYGKKLEILSAKMILFYNVALIVLVYIPFQLVTTFTQIGQVLGFMLFSISLAIDNPRSKYIGSISGIGTITLFSLFEVIRLLQLGNIGGAAISYTLFPLVVFVLYVKLWKTEMA